MSLEEATKKRLELELQITKMLQEFQNETDLDIDSMTFHRADSGNIFVEIKAPV